MRAEEECGAYGLFLKTVAGYRLFPMPSDVSTISYENFLKKLSSTPKKSAAIKRKRMNY